MNELMTRRDLDALAKAVRLKAKSAKGALVAVAAARREDAERQLSAVYPIDAAPWKDITTAAEHAVQEADAKLAAICEARGIRAEFRPKLSLSWWDRGENLYAKRRSELRTLAIAQIAADKKAAEQAIEMWSADRQVALIATGLTTDAARTFLDSLPSPESLLPPVQIRAELGDGVTEAAR